MRFFYNPEVFAKGGTASPTRSSFRSGNSGIGEPLTEPLWLHGVQSPIPDRGQPRLTVH